MSGATKFTPWQQGRLLATATVSRWTEAQKADASAIERKLVFSNFTVRDEGKSRKLVARFEREEDALLGSLAPELLATLEYLLPHLAELDRAERHRNRNNPTAVLHAQICINNVRNAVAKARGEA